MICSCPGTLHMCCMGRGQVGCNFCLVFHFYELLHFLPWHILNDIKLTTTIVLIVLSKLLGLD